MPDKAKPVSNLYPSFPGTRLGIRKKDFLTMESMENMEKRKIHMPPSMLFMLSMVR